MFDSVIAILYSAAFVLTAAVLVAIAIRQVVLHYDGRIQPVVIWVIVIVMIPFWGAIAWLVFSMRSQRRPNSS